MLADVGDQTKIKRSRTCINMLQRLQETSELDSKVGDGEGTHPGAMCKDTRGTVSWMSWKADNTDLGLDVSSSATQPLGLEEV